MKRFARPAGAVGAGTLVLVIWGMIYWALLASPLGVYEELPNEEEVTAALVAGGATTGTYFMPWPRDTKETFEEFVEQHKRGPFFELRYIAEPVDPESPGKILLGTLQYVTVAAMAVLILMLAGGSAYWKRALIVFVAGLMGTNFIQLADPIWFHLPWDYVLGVLVFEVVAWALLAAVTAKIVPAP